MFFVVRVVGFVPFNARCVLEFHFFFAFLRCSSCFHYPLLVQFLDFVVGLFFFAMSFPYFKYNWIPWVWGNNGVLLPHRVNIDVCVCMRICILKFLCVLVMAFCILKGHQGHWTFEFKYHWRFILPPVSFLQLFSFFMR